MYVCMCTYTLHVYRGHRSMSVSSLVTLHLIVWGSISHWIWSTQIQLDLLATEHQESTWLCLARAWLQLMLPCLAFYVGVEMWTQDLTFVWKTLYPFSYLPNSFCLGSATDYPGKDLALSFNFISKRTTLHSWRGYGFKINWCTVLVEVY